MGAYLQILALTVSGILLVWFGYTLFFGKLSPFFSGGLFPPKKEDVKGEVGEPQICPLCSIKLNRGDLVKSLAFPSLTGGKDRLMYIRGCFSCLYRDLPRRCPVCGNKLHVSDYLISRMFERPNNRKQVHVLGCNHCRKSGGMN
jgi:hypothetical protein